MTDALRLEVKKDSWKQNQDGTYKLTLTLNPTDLDDNAQPLLMDFIKAAMGTRYYVGMAEIGNDDQPVAKAPPAATEKPKERFADMRLSVQAGIMAQDERFHAYLRASFLPLWKDCTIGAGMSDKEAAASVTRALCDVDSRAKLDTVGSAGSAWMNLNAKFESWSGQVAQER